MVVGSDFKLNKNLQQGLALGLNFVLYPGLQRKDIASIFTASAHQARLLLDEWTSRHFGQFFIWNEAKVERIWNSLEQQQFQRMYNDKDLPKLLEEHVLSDKGQKKDVVSKTWCEEKCKNFLDGPMYTKVVDILDFDKVTSVLDPFYCQFKERVTNVSMKFFKLLPDEENIKLPFFYVIPKTHKDPIAPRPITGACNAFFTKASKFCSNALNHLFRSLFKTLREEGQESSLAICINTKIAISSATNALE